MCLAGRDIADSAGLAIVSGTRVGARRSAFCGACVVRLIDRITYPASGDRGNWPVQQEPLGADPLIAHRSLAQPMP